MTSIAEFGVTGNKQAGVIMFEKGKTRLNVAGFQNIKRVSSEVHDLKAFKGHCIAEKKKKTTHMLKIAPFRKEDTSG